MGGKPGLRVSDDVLTPTQGFLSLIKWIGCARIYSYEVTSVGFGVDEVN